MTSILLKPIETFYKGYRFRSRLEARWAVYFDSLGLLWDYEPEGFNLKNGEKYLPDFRVKTPQGEPMWVEVKPLSSKADPKFSQFQKDLNYSARSFLVSGDPIQHLSSFNTCPRCGMSEPIQNHDDCLGSVWFSLDCHWCDCETPCGGDNPEQTDGLGGCHYTPHKGSLLIDDWNRIHLGPLIDAAMKKARTARFEHGECG